MCTRAPVKVHKCNDIEDVRSRVIFPNYIIIIIEQILVNMQAKDNKTYTQIYQEVGKVRTLFLRATLRFCW